MAIETDMKIHKYVIHHKNHDEPTQVCDACWERFVALRRQYAQKYSRVGPADKGYCNYCGRAV